MSRHLSVFLSLLLTACSGATALPDASVVPRSPEGTFVVTSELDLVSQVPIVAAPIIESLLTATDDPDDPARYLVDRMIAEHSALPWEAPVCGVMRA